MGRVRWSVLARHWLCLIFGGALLMPYMMAGQVVWSLYGPSAPGDPLLAVQPVIFLAVLPIVALTGLALPVRELAAPPARDLLGAPVEPPRRDRPRTWDERRRSATWFTVHLAVGGVASGCTLAVAPFAVWTFLVPIVGNPLGLLGRPYGPGWSAAWWPPLGLASLAALLALVRGAGVLLARLAPALLGPSAAERLAQAEAHAQDLAGRARLARELHDSVGHALSVVTLQAAAAGRVLERDPATARTALAAIEHSARAALDDLDHVLGLLRDETPDRQPTPTLADLDDLIRASGAQVHTRIGDLTAVPALVSREAYRILQESLTNAIKHGHGPVRLAAAVHDDALHLQIANPLTPGLAAPAATGARGLAGMRERARLLRGTLQAGPEAGTWQVTVRLPLTPGSQ
ncbi:histidine kinase [Thermoactinospora rubra]|uniref:sensor histidine kinase n=1 Tax=Thermoactinospora rubra TaxID=1088767 RepID=UPI000A104939